LVQLLEQKKKLMGFEWTVSLHLKSYMQKGDRPVLHGTVVEKRSFVFPEGIDLQFGFVYWNVVFYYPDLYIVCR